jgi:hypothetical protein
MSYFCARLLVVCLVASRKPRKRNLGPIAKLSLSDVQGIEVAGAVVAVVQFVLLAVAIKKIRDLWLS